MSFLGGIIHGAIDGAGEQGDSNSTLAIGLRIHEQNMANLRARREEVDRIVAARNAQARANYNPYAGMAAWYYSPEEVERRRLEEVAREQREIADRKRAAAEAERDRLREIRYLEVGRNLERSIAEHNLREQKAREIEQKIRRESLEKTIRKCVISMAAKRAKEAEEAASGTTKTTAVATTKTPLDRLRRIFRRAA
jgi:hypothetical protein